MVGQGRVSAGTGARPEPRLGGLLGAGFLSALLFGASGFVPALAPLSLLSPLPLAVQRLQGGALSAWLAAALASAVIAAVSVPSAALAFLLVLALPGLLLAEALARGRMIDDEGGVLWIEEPIRADDFSGCKRVRDEIRTPIQIGENFMGPEQMAQALAAGACDYVMPDAQRIGGVTGWMRASALAQAAGLEMSSHLFPEVSAHLLAVTPTAHWLEYVDWADAVLEEPLRVKAGMVQLPERPGVGIAWNEEAVRRYGI